MPSYRLNLKIFVLLAAAAADPALGQIGVPESAPTAGRDTTTVPAVVDAPLVLRANLKSRMLVALRGDSTLRTFVVAVGQDAYPTPVGSFRIKKLIWNPSWRPPPDADWAKGQTAKGPGEPGNPMKVVKIFFQEPDYYIHGTSDIKSLGSAASHGCLRMDPGEIADLARIIMERGGQPRTENWFWRIIHSRREEKVIYLNNPISLTITD